MELPRWTSHRRGQARDIECIDVKGRRLFCRSGARIAKRKGRGGGQRIRRTTENSHREDRPISKGKGDAVRGTLRSSLAPQIIFHIGSPAETQRGTLKKLPEHANITLRRDSGTKGVSTMKTLRIANIRRKGTISGCIPSVVVSLFCTPLILPPGLRILRSEPWTAARNKGHISGRRY